MHAMEFWLVYIVSLVVVLITFSISYQIINFRDTENFCITGKLSFFGGSAEFKIEKHTKNHLIITIQIVSNRKQHIK